MGAVVRRQDKRSIVREAIAAHPGMSDRQIARLCGVSHTLVGMVRTGRKGGSSQLQAEVRRLRAENERLRAELADLLAFEATPDDLETALGVTTDRQAIAAQMEADHRREVHRRKRGRTA